MAPGDVKRISLFFASLGFFITTCAHAFTLSNLDSPESFIVDPEDGSYYVSNIHGKPAEKDGDGYISKISPNGNTIIQKFIGEKKDELLLHAPKGIAVVGKNIFVADIDTVKGFNKETGKPSVLIDLSRFFPKFLNDVAADPYGVLYVSDTGADRIYKINTRKDYEVVILKEGKDLGGPNGLSVNPKTKNLMVATLRSGQILEIDTNSKVHVIKKGLKGLDGIDYDNEGNCYVSSFEKGEIYKIPYYGRGSLMTFMGGLTSPADISVDRRKGDLLIPCINGHSVTTVSLKSKNSTSL